MIKQYFLNVLIGVDQLGNALLGGDPDETISSRTGKHIRNHPADRGLYYWLGWILDKIDRNHCADSIEEDEGEDAIIE